MDLQDPLSKFQRSVFLVKILHILPKVVQRHRPLHQVKVKKKKKKRITKQTNKKRQRRTATKFVHSDLEAVPAEGHRSGR